MLFLPALVSFGCYWDYSVHPFLKHLCAMSVPLRVRREPCHGAMFSLMLYAGESAQEKPGGAAYDIMPLMRSVPAAHETE